MSEVSYEKIMESAMESLRQMIDVNTIVGAPIPVPDGSVILPVCRASFGLVAGAGEYNPEKKPFAGGTGAGVTLNPVAFLVAGCEPVRVIPALSSNPYDKLIDAIPQAFSELRAFFKEKKECEMAEAFEE